MVEEAAKWEEQDKRARASIEARNQLEVSDLTFLSVTACTDRPQHYAFHVRNALDKASIPAEQTHEVQEAVKAALNWLDEHAVDASVEEIQQQHEALERVARPVLAKADAAKGGHEEDDDTQSM
jgi:heat shock protein 5